ncbi:uncharacterized protein PAC_02524 [Phialocephala subalpina]|uniref:2EXR domain-containing protein n=1 Tax=Phialocephala subalpina TaxID=576137 RepID=A0A1L7WIP6_9HELO|nr:uncharacterized protein PAC_02524 [Phialocephala subalpina]
MASVVINVTRPDVRCTFRCCRDAQLDTFTVYSELPAELRLKIWQHTFEPRTVHMYLGENGEPDEDEDGEEDGEDDVDSLPLLQVTIASDQPLPEAFSVCKESREFAMIRYTTLLTSDPLDIEEILRISNPTRFSDVKILGSRYMPIDLERDTLVITDLATPLDPAMPSFIAKHRVRNLVLSQATLEHHTTWDVKWAKVAANFPNLKTLNLAFGDRTCPMNSDERDVEDHLIPMDSNLEDLFHFFHHQFGRNRNRPGADMNCLFFEFQQSSIIKEKYWAFATGDKAPSQWFKMVFTTSFWTTKRALDHLLSVGWPMQISNVRQLPRDERDKWRDALPRTFWFRRDVCYRDDSLRSRYDGIQQLFSE